MGTQYSKRNIFIFCVVCFLTNLGFYPYFLQTSAARYFVIVLWGVLLFKSIIVERVIPLYKNGFSAELFLYICFIVCSSITFFCGGTRVFSNHFFRTVSIAMMILLIGYMNGESLGRKGLEAVCMVYMHTMFIMSVPLFVFYQLGTDLSSPIYSYEYGKNEIATLLAVAFIFGMVLYTPQKTKGKLYRLGGLALCVLNLVFLRCRTALLCVAVSFMVVFFLGKNISRKIKVAVLLLGVAFIVFALVFRREFNNFLNDIVFAGRDSSSLDSLSSGRLTQIKTGLDIFFENMLAGVGARRTLDCFFVSVLANYGLGAWSIIMMALMPLFWSVRYMSTDAKLGPAFLLVSIAMIITALLEELAPFGTGTRCYILWLMWGILMRRPQKESSIQEETAAIT